MKKTKQKTQSNSEEELISQLASLKGAAIEPKNSEFKANLKKRLKNSVEYSEVYESSKDELKDQIYEGYGDDYEEEYKGRLLPIFLKTAVMFSCVFCGVVGVVAIPLVLNTNTNTNDVEQIAMQNIADLDATDEENLANVGTTMDQSKQINNIYAGFISYDDDLNGVNINYPNYLEITDQASQEKTLSFSDKKIETSVNLNYRDPLADSRAKLFEREDLHKVAQYQVNRNKLFEEADAIEDKDVYLEVFVDENAYQLNEAKFEELSELDIETFVDNVITIDEVAEVHVRLQEYDNTQQTFNSNLIYKNTISQGERELISKNIELSATVRFFSGDLFNKLGQSEKLKYISDVINTLLSFQYDYKNDLTFEDFYGEFTGVDFEELNEIETVDLGEIEGRLPEGSSIITSTFDGRFFLIEDQYGKVIFATGNEDFIGLGIKSDDYEFLRLSNDGRKLAFLEKDDASSVEAGKLEVFSLESDLDAPLYLKDFEQIDSLKIDGEYAVNFTTDSVKIFYLSEYSEDRATFNKIDLETGEIEVDALELGDLFEVSDLQGLLR